MTMTTRTSIPAAEFAELYRSGRVKHVIDVRTPVEFREVHLERARNVPLDRLNPRAEAAKLKDDEPIYVVCKSGTRGGKACDQFRQAGIHHVINIEGGTQALIEAGLPVVRGKKAMSLERQVRIAAGALVLAGTLLGAFVHPYFLGLAGFVGAGLVFAGITDTCGMAMLLARMPWNQVASTTAAPASASASVTASASAPTCSR